MLRWELLDGASLDVAVRYLRDRGYSVYLVADPGETALFRQQFNGMTEARALDRATPVVIPGEVRVYPLGGTAEPPQYAAVAAATRHPRARD